MTGSHGSFEPFDETYDEQEAKHRFESALRAARKATHPPAKGMVPKREKKHAVSEGGSPQRKGGEAEMPHGHRGLKRPA
ncbi:hypothetical protein SAMN05519103_02830 [Rhizobiales bacterium GAS113]|jgi:hypothetical protein|nr:hypothetical protein SAMN05519103_02830 [Rhizobiales bacterium GAS113]